MAQKTYEIDGEAHHLHYSMARLEAAEQACAETPLSGIPLQL